MSKFIACRGGNYINIKQIISFYVYQIGNENYQVKFDTKYKSYTLFSMSSHERAQKYLDETMMKYGLALGVIKEN